MKKSKTQLKFTLFVILIQMQDGIERMTITIIKWMEYFDRSSKRWSYIPTLSLVGQTLISLPDGGENKSRKPKNKWKDSFEMDSLDLWVVPG